MKKFCVTFLKFILPIIIVTIGADLLFKFVVKNKTDFSLSNSVATIFLGHSQPEGAFNDSLIAHTKNLCNGGEAYLYSYKKLQIVLQHNPQVKNVIISFSNNQIEKKMDEWTYDDEHLEQYFSKYNFQMNSEEYLKVLKNNPTGTLKAEFQSIVHNAKSIVKRNNAFANNNFGGYLYLKRFKTDSLLKNNYIEKLRKEISDTISQTNIEYLKKMVTLCKEKKVAVFFVRTPIHNVLFNVLNEIEFQEIRKKEFNEIPFLDLHNFPLSNDEFGDFLHLNYKGAKKFSVFFNDLLENGILESQQPQQMINLEIGKSNLK